MFSSCSDLAPCIRSMHMFRGLYSSCSMTSNKSKPFSIEISKWNEVLRFQETNVGRYSSLTNSLCFFCLNEFQHTRGGWGSGFIPIAEYGAEFRKGGLRGKPRKPVRLLYSGKNHYDLLVWYISAELQRLKINTHNETMPCS